MANGRKAEVVKKRIWRRGWVRSNFRIRYGANLLTVGTIRWPVSIWLGSRHLQWGSVATDKPVESRSAPGSGTHGSLGSDNNACLIDSSDRPAHPPEAKQRDVIVLWRALGVPIDGVDDRL